MGDNDYGNTFRPLLQSLKLIIDHWEDEKEITEDDIRTVIDYSVFPFYVAFQALDRKDKPDRSMIENYLLGYKLLLDEEAEADIQTQHEARKNPALTVERQEWDIVNMPPFGSVKNRVNVLFNADTPIV